MLASGISLAKLAPGSAGVLKSNGTVITAGNLITSADIQDGQIVNADISASAGIDGAKLLDNSIPATKLTGGASIPANSIDASHLIDGSIMNAEINAAAAIVVSKLAHVGAGNVLKSNGTSNVAGQVATADLAANAVSRVFFQNSGGAFSSGGTAGAWAATGNNLALTGLTIGSLVSVWYTGTAYHSAPPQGLNVGLSLDAAANVVATTFVSALAASAYSQLAFVGQFTASATTHTLLEVVNVSAATFTRAGNPSIMALEMKR
jgi:hypothetical protein